jgi:hypothetical protein
MTVTTFSCVSHPHLDALMGDLDTALAGDSPLHRSGGLWQG